MSAVSWNRGRSVDGLGGDVGNSLALIPDISNEASGGVSDRVGHNLGATVGTIDTVFASRGVSVTVLVVAKVGSSCVAVSVNSVTEFICWGINVVGFTVSWSRTIDRGRGVDGPRSVWGWHDPDEGSVGMCVWAVSADSGNEAKESDKGLNFLKFYFIFCFDKSFSFYNACDKVPSDKFTKSI